MFITINIFVDIKERVRMQLNRCMRDQDGEIYDILAGKFLVVGLTEQNFGSLTPEQVEKFSAYYETLHMFDDEVERIKYNGSLIPAWYQK